MATNERQSLCIVLVVGADNRLMSYYIQWQLPLHSRPPNENALLLSANGWCGAKLKINDGNGEVSRAAPHGRLQPDSRLVKMVIIGAQVYRQRKCVRI